MFKILKLIIIIAAALGAAIFISTTYRQSSDSGRNLSPFGRSPIGGELKISTSTLSLETFQKISTTSEDIIKIIPQKPILKTSESIAINPVKNKISNETKEVSSRSFEELINSSVIQLYCGYLDGEQTSFSSIARGTGIIINSQGAILTNRHIIYDSNLKKIKSDCFVLKSPFPNVRSGKPKIYYAAEIINYPSQEKFNDSFSKERYYNDFAILKIASRPTSEMKINQLLQTDYASEVDYSVLENNGPPGGEAGVFNYLPIDWQYQPKNNDSLITLGYGVDASHAANQITSTIGRLAGNVDIKGDSRPQILLVESNATTGFSGGALINPQSKGLIGLISWITVGDVTGKYTVAIFRDFLAETMLQDLNFDLK